MNSYEALNLLQAIESGTTDAVALEAILISLTNGVQANAAGFGAFISIRANARRMAANAVTMSVINGSVKAIQTVFASTTAQNYSIVQEVAKSSAAMSDVAYSYDALEAVIGNDVAFSYFKMSPYYDDEIIKILSVLVGKDPSLYANVYVLTSNAATMGDIAVKTSAMKALVANEGAMTAAASDSDAIGDIASYVTATTLVAQSDSAMKIIGESTTALNMLKSAGKEVALANIFNTPSAVKVLSANETAWQSLMSASTTLSDNIYDILITVCDLDPLVHVSVEDIFTDTAASSIVANITPAMVAIIYEVNTAAANGVTSVMDKIIASENLATVLGASTAMNSITANVPTMENLIANTTAFPILLSSAAAKATIFDSDVISGGTIDTSTLFYKMMNNPDARSVVAAGAQSLSVSNDALVGTFKPSGLSGNIIVMTAQMGSLVAATNVVSFQTSGVPATLFTKAVPGVSLVTSPVSIDRPYTDMELDVDTAAGTAAGNVNLTYVTF